MTTIVTREVGATAKGSPLTNAEVDNNFINLNTNKVETADFDPLARPSIRPSLLLDFANSKQLDSRITFTRASTATYYDGVTQAKAEENLLKYSQEFDNGAWAKNGVGITTNGGVAPDGSSTAELLVESTSANDNHRVYQTFTAKANATNTFSIYVKVASGARYAGLRLAVTASNFAHCVFDLAAGTYSLGANATAASIVNVGGGWFRLSMTATNTVGGTENPVFYISHSATPPATDATGALYTGDGASGFYIWGAQIEQRSQVTSYTPTTDQPITKYQPVLQTAASGVPRFDHNPVTGESLGLLIEEQRTNLLLNSSTLMSVSLSNGVRLANQLVAPDGTLSASVINGVGGASAATWTQSASATAATMTFSCYVKTGLLSSVTSYSFLLRNSTTGTDFSLGTFNQTTGAITGTGWSSAHVGNGWYRLSYTNQASETITAGNVITCYFGATGGLAYATSVALGIWGIQLEAGSFPTSYIPTTTAQVTRAVDVADMTGASFTAFFNNSEGGVYAEASRLGDKFADGSSNFGPVISFGQSSSSEIYLTRIDNTARWISAVPGTTAVSLQSSAEWLDGQFARMAATYGAPGTAFSLNAGSVITNSTALTPFATTMRIGNRFGTSGNPWNGHIKKLAYYPKRLSSTELQALTA